MRVNADTVLVGTKVALVPYLPEHVPVRLYPTPVLPPVG
jgi:hypothetical protein